MILLWGLSGDDPFDEVRNSLERRGAEFVVLDQRDLLEINLYYRNGATLPSVQSGTSCFDLDDVTAAYLRVYDWRTLPGIAETEARSDVREHAFSIESALRTWVETTEALVVNRPSAMASNNSKPFQAQIILEHGFRVPETLITTDPDAAIEFRKQHHSVVYKSISGVRSVVSQFTGDDPPRLEMLRWCPTQFQERIPGRDYRVNVVGSRIFPCEILCDADDYRYAGRDGIALDVRACTLPDELADRATRLAAALELHAAGIDLRRTPDDRWYCFEVNPSPGFTFYEAHTGQRIADAIAELLQDNLQDEKKGSGSTWPRP